MDPSIPELAHLLIGCALGEDERSVRSAARSLKTERLPRGVVIMGSPSQVLSRHDKGRVNQKVDPAPTALVTPTRPPCARMMALQM